MDKKELEHYYFPTPQILTISKKYFNKLINFIGISNFAWKKISSQDDIYLLRLVCLTGPVLHLLDENLAKKVLIRINMINRGKQISDILINLVEESIDNKNNIFKKLEYSEQNDILDSLFNMFKDKKNNNLTEKAKNLYNLIIKENDQNKNEWIF